MTLGAGSALPSGNYEKKNPNSLSGLVYYGMLNTKAEDFRIGL